MRLVLNDVKQISNYFIGLSIKYGSPINLLKLQKLLYYAQGWYLALFHKRLFIEDILVGKNGPYISTIKSTNYIEGIKKLHNHHTELFLDKIWEVYGKLANSSHIKDGPWYKSKKAGLEIIPEIELTKFFTKQIYNND